MRGLDELLRLARQWWPTRAGLVASLLVTLVVALAIAGVGQVRGIWLAALLLGFGTATSVAWYALTQRVPKNRGDRIGFAVAIRCEDEQVQREVITDFVQGLETQVSHSDTGQHFNFVTVPPHLAETVVSPDDARRLQRKSGCHFILYGSVRRRQIGGTNTRLIDLNGLIAHPPLQPPVQEHLREEFTELIPSKVRIEDDISVLGLEVTSSWAHVVAKYIIGLTMALSGQFEEARVLLDDAEALAAKDRTGFPAYAKIRKQVPQLRASMELAKARHYFELWRDRGRAPECLTAMSDHLQNVDVLGNHVGALVLRAFEAFLVRCAPGEARNYLLKVPVSWRDAIWHYNVGFLYAYEGNLKRATYHYTKGAKLPMPPEKIAELETFMCWVIEQEPDRYHLHYSLALLDRTLKGDSRSAVREFNLFLDQVPVNQYQTYQQRAREWLLEMQDDRS